MNLANRLNGLISKYFDKKGIADFTQLTDEERATYDKWQEILSAEVTVDKVKEFVTEQLARLGKDLQEAVKAGDDRKALLITARIENYNDLHAVIEAPDKARTQLANLINNLMHHG